MDLNMLMKGRQAWNTFKSNHPKFSAFLLNAEKRGLNEGTVVTIEIRYPEGDTVKTNFRVKQEDLELMELARSVLSK